MTDEERIVLARRAARMGSADEVDEGEAAEVLVACADALTGLQAERDRYRASTETLASILDALSKRLTPEEGALVAREIATSVRPKEQAEEDLAKLRKAVIEAIDLYEECPDAWELSGDKSKDGGRFVLSDGKCIGPWLFSSLDGLTRVARVEMDGRRG